MPTRFWDVFRSRRVQLIVGGALLIPLFIFHFLFVKQNLTTTFDDAYMFVRYAENALAGHGIAWNSDGIQTYGATSLFYLGLVILGRAVAPSAEMGAMLVVLSALLGVVALVLMGGGFAKGASSKFFKQNPFLVPGFLALLFFLSPHYLFHATSGMDTTLALLCNTLVILAALHWVRRDSAVSLWLLVAAVYASFLARPDNLIYSALFPALYGLFFRRADRMKKLVWFGAGVTIVLGFDTAMKYAIFGDPLPLPFYAKTVGYDDGYAGAARWNPIAYLLDFLGLMFPFLLVALFSISKHTRLLAAAFFTPVLVTFVYFFSVTQIMGFGARYYFPATPFFVMGALLLLDQRLERERLADVFRRPLRVVGAALLALMILFPPVGTLFESAYERTFIPAPRVYESELAQAFKTKLPPLGWWQSIEAMSAICEKLPAETKVGMSEYGLVGARCVHIHIIDLLGLHDPFFAHHGFSSAEFFNRQPDLIWLPYPDYTKIVAAIQNDLQFLEGYDYYPGAFDYGVAIRRDAENYRLIYDAVRAVWRVTYPGVEMDASRFSLP